MAPSFLSTQPFTLEALIASQQWSAQQQIEKKKPAVRAGSTIQAEKAGIKRETPK